MDLSFLYRLKGTLEGTASHENGDRLGGGYVTAWPRLRREVLQALPEHRAEIDRLFPEQLSTSSQPPEQQAEESIMFLAQLAGWIGGVIAEAEVQQRLAAELAEASKPPMGFGAEQTGSN
jgi:hypothetical protein